MQGRAERQSNGEEHVSICEFMRRCHLLFAVVLIAY